jgi:hypothetical protein
MGPNRAPQLDDIDFVRTAGVDYRSTASFACAADSRPAINAHPLDADHPGTAIRRAIGIHAAKHPFFGRCAEQFQRQAGSARARAQDRTHGYR